MLENIVEIVLSRKVSPEFEDDLLVIENLVATSHRICDEYIMGRILTSQFLDVQKSHRKWIAEHTKKILVHDKTVDWGDMHEDNFLGTLNKILEG